MVVSMSFDENKKFGHISVNRSILHWEWWEDINTFRVFMYCLLKANHKDVKYKGMIIKRGSFITSYELLSKETTLTLRNVRTALKHLELTHEVTCIKSRKGTIISIKNYDKYQSVTHKVTSNRQTSDKQVTTNNNDNNDNNGGVAYTTPITDTNFLRFWDVYLKHGFMDDTYKFWLNQDYDEKEIECIIYGAEMYSEEHKDNVRHMIFPRTFLKDEKWKDYQKKDEDELLRKQQEQLDYLRSQGVDI